MNKAPTEIYNTFKTTLISLNKKPYLPYWGELFIITKELINYSKEDNKEIYFYNTHDNTPILYVPQKKSFVVQTSVVHINLDQIMFVDALYEGRFWPDDL
ncbi:hypothetical protein [Halalkalibacter urbisdiaboli]|uniref:hypothetical protein n=1 Tax=Halalkalibacter urbisdiaboli TaxID=1960589 RepID=UPI000B43D979|nr:hypothetical protein [Halalkalibacter urbisdiaboli]